jgi:hypothetical protein
MDFFVDYNADNGKPIRIGFDLPYAGSYQYSVELTWQDWISINTWLQDKLAKGLRGE